MTNTQDIIRQIEKYKRQSLYYMIALIVGIGVSIVLFLQLQAKKQELEKTQAELNAALAELGLAREQNEEWDSYTNRIDRVSKDIKSLGKERWPDQDLSAREVVQKLRAEVEEKRKGRPQAPRKPEALIEDLFSGNESTRRQATDDILKYYREDEQILPALFEATKDKMDEQHQNSIYQVLYIIQELPKKQVVANKSQILTFINKMRQAELVGNQTRERVANIRKKMGPENQ